MSNKYFSLIACIFLFILIIFLSLALSFAWFSYSDTVEANGPGISVGDGQQFLFASKGNFSFYHDIEEELGYNAGIETVIDDQTFYRSGSGEAMCLMVNADSHFDNLTGTDVKQKISPGDYGKVTFYIMVSNGSAFAGETAKLSVSVLCYKVGLDNTTERVSSDFLEDLVKGHILFFTNYDEESGFYSGWINDGDDFTVEFEEGDKYKEVTLYWVWPTYFEQLVKHSADRKSICINGSTDMDRLRQDVMDYPEQYLSLNDGRFEGEITNFDRINELHNLYNAADESIGIEADFLLLEFKVNGGE